MELGLIKLKFRVIELLGSFNELLKKTDKDALDILKEEASKPNV
jgi:hypothetical protein